MSGSANGRHAPTTSEMLKQNWREDPRWQGVRRDYAAEDVLKLRPSLLPEPTLARAGAERLWSAMQDDGFVRTFGALTGAQAVQMAKAGLQALYVSGWQVAADANQAGHTYPDQSLYPSNSVPALVRRLNNALMRADQVDRLEGRQALDYYLPIVADAEAGFGGAIHAFELMRNMIEAGAAAVHFEDQLAAEKKCGHMGGKVLVPTSQHVRTLQAARLAADVMGVPTLVMARTDALSASLMTTDIDERDRPFITGERTTEGYFQVRGGLDSAIARALAYAPYSDLIWCETSTPDLGEAREFADAVHAEFPDQMLAYNCSPSFNWKLHLQDTTIASFQEDLAAMGYSFQFITLAGWHGLNYHTFDLADRYRDQGMTAFVELQEDEFEAESRGYTATKHQREAGTSYFDEVLMTVTGGESATTALAGSTEAAQFAEAGELAETGANSP